MMAASGRFFKSQSGIGSFTATVSSAASGGSEGRIQGFFDGLATYNDDLYDPYTLPGGTTINPTTFSGINIKGLFWTGANDFGTVTFDADTVVLLLQGNVPSSTVTNLYINKDGNIFNKNTSDGVFTYTFNGTENWSRWMWGTAGSSNSGATFMQYVGGSLVTPTSLIIQIT